MIKNNVNALEEVKIKIARLKGQSCDFCINKGRKKFEKFSGRVDNVYPSVFTVCEKENEDKSKTFSYFDVLCGNVVISN